jgi:hypothetical protein
MKAYRGRRGTVLLILNLGASWRSVVNITTLLLYLWERTLVPIEWEAGWNPQPVHMFWRGENLLPMPGFEPWFIIQPTA